MNIKSVALIFMSLIVRASILALAILAVYRVGQEAYDFGFRIFTEEAVSPAPGRDVAVTIVKGDSTAEVGKMLEEKGLIRDYKLFVVQKKCSVYDDDIKPGFYTLNTSMTAEDMFAVIAGRKDEEGAEGEETEEGLDMSIEVDPSTEGDSAIEKASGEWEGTEGEEEEIHDPYEEGANVEEGEDTEAAEEEDDQ